MPRILLINPNTSQATTAMMVDILRGALPDGHEVIGVTARRGVAMITEAEELLVAVDEVIALSQRHADEVDAIVIAAFADPGLAEVRKLVALPVVGIGEASLHEAAAGGRRFGVATTTPGLDEPIAAAVRACGLDAQFTGTRIPDADPLGLAADPARQAERLAEAVVRCLEDGAEAVVIGGGPLSASAQAIAPRFAVPVISAAAAAGRALQERLRPLRPARP